MLRNVLLITATITPLPGLHALARTDPKLRMQVNTNVAKLSTLAIGRAKEICEAIQHSKRVLASNDQFG